MFSYLSNPHCRSSVAKILSQNRLNSLNYLLTKLIWVSSFDLWIHFECVNLTRCLLLFGDNRWFVRFIAPTVYSTVYWITNTAVYIIQTNKANPRIHKNFMLRQNCFQYKQKTKQPFWITRIYPEYLFLTSNQDNFLPPFVTPVLISLKLSKAVTNATKSLDSKVFKTFWELLQGSQMNKRSQIHPKQRRSTYFYQMSHFL